MSEGVKQYDSINELVIVGEFGYDRFEGPWALSYGGTNRTVVMPHDEADRTPDANYKDFGAVLIADGKAVGGGLVDTIYDPEGEGETHVVVDQYAMGGPK